MIIEGQVTRSGDVTDKDGKPYTFDNGNVLQEVVIEGIQLRPGQGVDSLPNQGDMVRATVNTHWRQGKGPIHYMGAWRSIL